MTLAYPRPRWIQATAGADEMGRQALRPKQYDLGLRSTLSRFHAARCILECAVRSLEEWHDPDTGIDQEAICLRHGLDLLARVYDEVDTGIQTVVSSSQRPE
jgi:hypothetical protein